MSEEQLGRLATSLKNRIASVTRNPELRLSLFKAINAGLQVAPVTISSISTTISTIFLT